MEYLYFFLVVIGCALIFWLVTHFAMKIIDKFEKKDIVIEKRQNIKIGNKWVTLTNKEPEPIEPKYTDYELELINEIDNAYREYLNKNNCFKNDAFINTECECITYENGETIYINLQSQNVWR